MKYEIHIKSALSFVLKKNTEYDDVIALSRIQFSQKFIHTWEPQTYVLKQSLEILYGI